MNTIVMIGFVANAMLALVLLIAYRDIQKIKRRTAEKVAQAKMQALEGESIAADMADRIEELLSVVRDLKKQREKDAERIWDLELDLECKEAVIDELKSI